MTEKPKDGASEAGGFFGFVLIVFILFFVIGDCAKFPEIPRTPVRDTKPSTGKTQGKVTHR